MTASNIARNLFGGNTMTATPDLHHDARAGLRDTVADLALSREHFKNASALLASERIQHEKVFQERHAALLADVTEARTQMERTERSLRTLALEFGEVSGERHPVPGVELIHQTKLDYDDADALKWALGTGLAITLNRKELERIAKAAALPFVTVSDVLAVHIATDLDAALASAEAV